MQKVLSFTEGKKKYVSKPFDFEAMCLIQEIHVTRETDSIGRLCGGAVDHLFEGTEATQDVLDRNPAEKMQMAAAARGELFLLHDLESAADFSHSVYDGSFLCERASH